MLDKQIDAAIERFLDREYGTATFAEFASNRMGVEYDPADFARSDFTEAEKTARDKAERAIDTQVHEFLEENLGAEDPKEWNWQALANQVNTRWGLKTTDRQLKQIGKDNLSEYLRDEANKCVAAIDLNDGRPYLEDDWGVRSLCDWVRLKFQIKLDAAELKDRPPADLKQVLHDGVMALYRQKEIEFPVITAMVRFMADRSPAPGAGQRYNREGLYLWAASRFPQARERLNEEDFRTQSRARLLELLLDVSRSVYPTVSEEAIDAKLEEVFEGSRRAADAEDARDLAEWARGQWGLEVPEAELTGVDHDRARQVLWNAFDNRFRPEMHQMERSLVLSQLDSAWKNHLYTMDHLRSGIGLVGYAQEDPKTAYKQQGMKAFKEMQDALEDRVTDLVFRMEETEAFQESLWTIGATIHEAAPRAAAQAQMTNNGQGEKVTEPIRNRGEKVGRNDPCPCGSGKKYKNCHMRAAV
jgi:preprotein translocase subunit SecA